MLLSIKSLLSLLVEEGIEGEEEGIEGEEKDEAYHDNDAFVSPGEETKSATVCKKKSNL